MSCVEILAVKLKKYRAENKMSREELAHRIGISVRHLNDLENAYCQVLSDTIDAVCIAFDVTVSELFYYTDDDIKYYKLSKGNGIPIWKRVESFVKMCIWSLRSRFAPCDKRYEERND